MPRAARAAQQEPDPDPDPLEEDLEPDASGASGRASSVSDFIADPGPEFDPDEADEHARERDDDRSLSAHPGGETGIEVEWDAGVVKSMLTAQGSALHAVAGKADEDWLYTKDELAAIAPPLTRILNRYDATRVAAATGDELSLILGLSGHTMRSLQERRAALAVIKAQQEAEEAAAETFGMTQPTTGQEIPTA